MLTTGTPSLNCWHVKAQKPFAKDCPSCKQTHKTARPGRRRCTALGCAECAWATWIWRYITSYVIHWEAASTCHTLRLMLYFYPMRLRTTLRPLPKPWPSWHLSCRSRMGTPFVASMRCIGGLVSNLASKISVCPRRVSMRRVTSRCPIHTRTLDHLNMEVFVS